MGAKLGIGPARVESLRINGGPAHPGKDLTKRCLRVQATVPPHSSISGAPHEAPTGRCLVCVAVARGRRDNRRRRAGGGGEGGPVRGGTDGGGTVRGRAGGPGPGPAVGGGGSEEGRLGRRG